MKIPMIMVRWHDTSVNNIITIIIINIKSIPYGYNNNKKKLREIADSVTPLAGVRYSTYAESFFFPDQPANQILVQKHTEIHAEAAYQF